MKAEKVRSGYLQICCSKDCVGSPDYHLKILKNFTGGYSIAQEDHQAEYYCMKKGGLLTAIVRPSLSYNCCKSIFDRLTAVKSGTQMVG